MIVRADNNAYEGWALKDPRTGQIYLPEICDTEADAYALKRAMAVHQPNRGNWIVVPVSITVTERQR